MSRNTSLRCAKMQVGMEVKGVWFKRVDCIELYRESFTWQGLATTSRSSTSLPVVGSDSWVLLSNVGSGIPLCAAGYRLIGPYNQ